MPVRGPLRGGVQVTGDATIDASEDPGNSAATGADRGAPPGEFTHWLEKIAYAADRLATRPRLLVAVFLVGAGIALLYRPFSQMEVGDTSIYDYIAQAIVRGQLPYRDVVDIKWPGSHYLSALSILVGNLFGVRDILAIRALHVVAVGLLSVVIFLAAENYTRSAIAGVIAFIAPLITSRFLLWMVAGTQPKLFTILFGMLALVLLSRDRPFWAGLLSMLACTCWQPGLMFTGAVFLLASRYLTSWRDLRALRVAAGAAIPLVVLFGYFYLRGGLNDLWQWTIVYNYSVFGPEANRGAGGGFAHLQRVANRIFGSDNEFVLISAVGWLVFVIRSVWWKFKYKRLVDPTRPFRDAIIWPPAVYFLFCLVNFQAGPDLIPFFPFIGIFAAYLFVGLGRFAMTTRFFSRLSGRMVISWIPQLAAATLLLLALGRGALYRLDTWTYRDQERRFEVIKQVLGPDDKLFVHGTTEILVLLNRPNVNPYVLLDWGADEFAASKRPGGFQQILDEIDAQQPRIVALSRLKTLANGPRLMEWAQSHYEKLDVPDYDGIFVRRDGRSAGGFKR
ncbi:MAG TPA: DolP-mannose mannosyltransferase [Blastocatellia bacterium]|nr:DolP-mannose mannosyltransferase [Blastocatellia bacterium]